MLPDTYEVIFSADKVEIRRIDGKIETHLDVTVSPEANCEVRRVTLTNHDSRTHDLEVTSYAEPVLAPHAADLAHPAFGKLFLETESPFQGAILCRRRPRSVEDKPLWGAHILASSHGTPHAHGERGTDGSEILNAVQWETDRLRFLGRGRTPANAQAMATGQALSGHTGAVLDPVFSLRQRVRLAPGASAMVAFTTAMAESREEALALADSYHDFHGINRAFELAWAHSQVELQHHHLTTQDMHLFQRLASHLIYSGPFLRADPDLLARNRQGQTGLWRHGISGDKPIVLLQIDEMDHLLLVRQLLLAHTYWRLKGLEADLVILNRHPTSYVEEVQQQVLTLVRTSHSPLLIDKPGGVFVRQADHFSAEDLILLAAAARVVLSGADGLLGEQLDEKENPKPETRNPKLETRNPKPETRNSKPETKKEPLFSDLGSRISDIPPKERLLFTNGYGGFTEDGKEYVIQGQGATSSPGGASARTPAPWINVVANENCGFLVSESGSGYTWAGNSQANRLTPWSNDPVSDPPGEVIYVRDEATGDLWTAAGGGQAQCRHGQGYTLFRQRVNGIDSELLLLVPPQDPLKLLRLRLRNPGKQSRRLSVTFYAEWVLGSVRDQAAMQVLCEVDADTGAILARNPFSLDFAGRVAFADVNLRPRAVTANRTEFLGRLCNLKAPAAVVAKSESRKSEKKTDPSSISDFGFRLSDLASDPCAALQVRVELPPDKDTEVVFLLGQAADLAEARRLVTEYRQPGRALRRSRTCRRWWDQVLTTVQVRTPNQAMDLLLNRWLLYQTLGCRYLARSAFYQSSGAYGFRDQLQDVCALVYAAPELARSTSCAPPAGNLPRATCSTGGTHPAAAASARASPMTTCGYRSWWTIM